MHPLATETERLRLRLLDQRDRNVYCGLYTDPRAMRLITTPLDADTVSASFASALRANRRPPVFPAPGNSSGPAPGWSEQTPFKALPWQRRQGPIQSLRVVGETIDGTDVVAIYGLERWDESGAQWEMGVMAPVQAHGRGYAVEGMLALVERLFEAGAARILLRCRAENLAACRVARRMGFQGREVESDDGRVMLWVRFAHSD
jgi:RimJ/RimL family protein N-acetyltransferase